MAAIFVSNFYALSVNAEEGEEIMVELDGIKIILKGYSLDFRHRAIALVAPPHWRYVV